MTAAVLPAQVTVRLVQSMRQLSTAVLALAAEMPAATAAMTAFVATLRTHLPADTATAATPDTVAADGRRCYTVLIWHDLLWYGHAKSAGVTSSGFTREAVLRDLREQIATLADLPDPDAVTLTTLPG